MSRWQAPDTYVDALDDLVAEAFRQITFLYHSAEGQARYAKKYVSTSWDASKISPSNQDVEELAGILGRLHFIQHQVPEALEGGPYEDEVEVVERVVKLLLYGKEGEWATANDLYYAMPEYWQIQND